MFFLNLSAGEFFTLLGTLGGLVTALYLLDRARRKKVVSTLRFWTSAVVAEDQQTRKHMNQPWSLVLQLLSLACLLLAVAQIQWGSRDLRGRDHVLLLDTSTWAGQSTETGVLLNQERQRAAQFIETLRPTDRVLLVRADALATPATSFTSNREQLKKALRDSTASLSALNISQALSFARKAQSWSGRDPGEIVYIGPGRIDENPSKTSIPRNLRVVTVPAEAENCRIQNITVKRSDTDANSWQATVTLKNDGKARRVLHLKTSFAGTRFGPRTYSLGAGQELAAEYTFITNTSGQFVAEFDPKDSLPMDDRAILQLPNSADLRITVYTERRELIDPLFRADPRMHVEYLAPTDYSARHSADLIILDSFSPAERPTVSSMWITPPRQNSTLNIKEIVPNAVIRRWDTDSNVAIGLHAREDQIQQAQVFDTKPGDIALASISEGPTIVLRAGPDEKSRLAAIGFDPLEQRLRFSVTTPLLFANLVHWLSPEAFRVVEVTASRVGAASVTLGAGEHMDQVKITNQRGFPIPFTSREQTVQLFASEPETVRITSTQGERILNLTLPDVASQQWKPTEIATGLPPSSGLLPRAVDPWRWLACLGGLGLTLEWFLFGRRRKRSAVFQRRADGGPAKVSDVRHHEELVSR